MPAPQMDAVMTGGLKIDALPDTTDNARWMSLLMAAKNRFSGIKCI